MFTWLLYNTICALPLAVAALLLRRWRRTSPTLEHLLWLAVLVRLVLPPLPSFGEAPAEGPQVFSSEPSWGDGVVAWMTRTFGNTWSIWMAQIAVGLFLVFLAWLLIRELLRVRRVDRAIRLARAAPGAVADRVRDVARRLEVRAPRVGTFEGTASPFLWSLRGPLLVLPQDEGLPAETVVAHELAHLRRRDHWTAWIELVVLGFHFWNPLYWLARRRMHLAAELACDDWVVRRFPRERRAYAGALVDAVERASTGKLAPRAVHAIGMDRRDFEERLHRILESGAASPRVGTAGAVVLSVLLFAVTAVPGVAAPSLARFRAELPELPSGLDETTWENVLDRAENRLAEDPEDGGAHQSRGMALLGLGRRDEALRAFQRQAELGFDAHKASYNQACVHALSGDPEAAIDALEHAAELGLDVSSYVEVDPDLRSLDGHPRLEALLDRLAGE